LVNSRVPFALHIVDSSTGCSCSKFRYSALA
jgi:hypothetical protein